jgi:hypothetical protein
MFRLIRWLFSLALLSVVAWFALTVPLGKRTLFAHLRAILATQEARELADGTKEEAERVVGRVRRELGKDGDGEPSPGGKSPPRSPPAQEPASTQSTSPTSGDGPNARRAPLEELSPRDRQGLDHLVRDKGARERRR